MNRILWALLVTGAFCIGGGFCGIAEAQSLTQQLLAEGATSLAKAARDRGDFVRGAILYPQKKLSCANCHAPGARNLGPGLTQFDQDVADEYFVESILQPSKVIKKGYESVKVLTRDGSILIGRVVKDDDTELILSDPIEPSRLIKIARANVDKVSPNEKSTMPDALADQLTDRQQFLDLIKYLLEISGTGTPTDATPAVHAVGQSEVDERLRGLVLIDEFNCRGCHEMESSDLLPRHRAPVLQLAAARIDPNYLQRFISDPLHVKPGTKMPDVMGSMQEDERRRVAEAITHYLVSLSGERFERQPVNAVAAERGRDLFHSVGCVACHSPRDAGGNESMQHDSVPLGQLKEKYGVEGLAAFLQDPHSVRPSGRMPNMVLTHWEATDLAHFLVSGKTDLKAPFGLDDSRVEAGRRFFVELGCAKCHEPSNERSEAEHTRLADLRLAKGCLSSKSGKWPEYQFSTSQLEAIRAAIRQSAGVLSSQQQITLAMKTFRCFACHQRGEMGGVPDDRNSFFHTTNENLGPQGRLPPTLTGVGAKLKPKWLRQVLVSGRTIRPYMKTRMPQYGTENVAHLVELYQRVDKLPDVDFGFFDNHKEAKKVGTELVGSGGLNCVACHTFQQKPSQTMPAVDLTEMAERLHKKWFYRYLLSPQSLSPNTVMPSFWPAEKSIRPKILSGDTNQQIEAIWTWMLDGRQARTPRGLHREPIEVLATDEAVMLRRSYPGIGKRGIGVGYPSGVNLAFDAEQLRIAMIWKGKFAEASGAWRGQGSGNVRPLGSDVIRFGPGPEFDDAQAPWVVDDGRPPHHQFMGYFLDDVQRPTFTYRFGTIEVEDYLVDSLDEQSGETVLTRTLTFTSDDARSDLTFRAGSSNLITPDNDGHFLLGESIRIRVESRQTPRIVDSADSKQLLIPLELTVGKSQLVIQYAW